jgi:adenine-specific DNA-methyltransferase
VETPEGEIIDLSLAQKLGREPMPKGRILKLADISSQTGGETTRFPIEYKGKTFYPSGDRGWSTNKEGIERLRTLGRLHIQGSTLWWKNYRDEFPYRSATRHWDDTRTNAFGDKKLYVVQTNTVVVQRCMLMTTDPGDIVLDPTCGSGTTAYVAEQWGRRWITIDTSRVPISLARQRLLTATFPYYELLEVARGPSAGFVYRRKQSRSGEESGGIVPRITLATLARGDPPEEMIIPDKPEEDAGIVRVAGPFTVEAVIPTPFESPSEDVHGRTRDVAEETSHVDRMFEILRRSPLLIIGKHEERFENVRRPTRAVDIHALGDQEFPAGAGEVAFVFGPLNGPVTEGMILRARRECYQKNIKHLYVIGFAIQDAASKMVAQSTDDGSVPVSYVAARPDIVMGDLLKTRKTDQMFVVTGRPDVKLMKLKKKGPDGKPLYRVELQGLDTFDPVNMDIEHKDGSDVPAWFLDTDYNEMCFWVSQAFFPKTGAWDNIKKALKGEYNESVFGHLAGTTSEAFSPGENERIAVKAVDARGNELLVVVPLSEAVSEA